MGVCYVEKNHEDTCKAKIKSIIKKQQKKNSGITLFILKKLLQNSNDLSDVTIHYQLLEKYPKSKILYCTKL